MIVSDSAKDLIVAQSFKKYQVGRRVGPRSAVSSLGLMHELNRAISASPHSESTHRCQSDASGSRREAHEGNMNHGVPPLSEYELNKNKKRALFPWTACWLTGSMGEARFEILIVTLLFGIDDE